MTEAEESDRRQAEFADRSKLFMDNLNVDEIANICIIAINTAKTPKSDGVKNRVNNGNNNNGINCEKLTPDVNTKISFKYFELTNS